MPDTTTRRFCAGCGGYKGDIPGNTCSSQCSEMVRMEAEADAWYAEQDDE
jgi:hypothetical protein